MYYDSLYVSALFNIQTNYFKKNKLKRAGNNLIGWGIIDGVGYLQIDRMNGFSNQNSKVLSTLDTILDTVAKDFSTLDKMIIDLRFNPGGWDIVSLEIYKRFIDKRTHVFSKKARYQDTFTNVQKIYVEPKGTPFKQEVIVLTRPFTASASEVFVLCTLENEKFTLMGGRTAGIFSDVLSKKLPNGWTVNLSNEVYQSSTGQVFEIEGIKPNIEIEQPIDATKYYTSFKEKDELLELALEKLKNKK